MQETYSKTGASKALRTLLRKHRKEVEEKQKARKSEFDTEVDL